MMHSPEGKLELGRSLARALANTGISVIYQDLDLRIVWSENAPSPWTNAGLIGKTDRDILGSASAQPVILAKQAVAGSGEPQSLEVSVDVEGVRRWYEIWIDADRDDSGKICGIITTAVDISDQKQREQTLRTLLREVSHRSKNLLAIIQSIATQTGRSAHTIDGFLTKFRGRIQSLAASQDLVTSSNWRGADLRELIAGQVGRYAGDPGKSIEVEGLNPYLNPNAALHIGLALHELAVNSASFGALSRGDGRIRIAAALAGRDDGGRELVLTWTEQFRPAPDGKLEKRFGTAALERVVPTSLNGRAELIINNGQVRYELRVPQGSFELN